jgi:nitrogen fixation protein NifQ
MPTLFPTAPLRPAWPLPAAPGGFRGLLLKLARRPDDLVPRVLAGVIGRSWTQRGLQCLPLYGIDVSETRRLLARHFPGAEWLPALHATTPAEFAEAIEMDDVVTLLREHLSIDDQDHLWLAHAVATGCLGADHLWQDMDLTSRAMLSELMHGRFTSLAERNTQDMKWKKFLYKQLCEREQIRVCKAPSCGVCTDYAVCFGPED